LVALTGETLVAVLALLSPIGFAGPLFYSSTRSNTTTLRSLSALMIFLVGGLAPERTMLIDDGVTPFSFAHSFWLPARFTSERSKRTTSF